MISEDTVNLLREVFCHPKDYIYEFLTFLRERKRDGRGLERRMLRNFVFNMPEAEAVKYREEIEFLKSSDLDYLATSVFPYPCVRSRGSAECGYDAAAKLPYVVHRGSRLYFTREDDPQSARTSYLNYVENEGLLGSGCLAKSPHSYVSDGFGVEDGDVLVDVGCAEALFTLDNIDHVKNAYVFETMNKWDAPLRATFSPFTDKVKIINKFVGSETKGRVVRLSDALPEDSSARYFIKMDIEGAEFDVLKGSADFLRTHKVKIACCLYHRQDDETRIVGFLRELDFSVQFSEGYMLPTFGGVAYPYFRRGMVYARNFQ